MPNPVSEWISVKDKLPPAEVEILAVVRERHGNGSWFVIKAVYGDKYNFKNIPADHEFYESCGCSGYECDDMEIEEVSHWMPLPQPPEE